VRVPPAHTTSRAEPCVCLLHTPRQNTLRDTFLPVLTKPRQICMHVIRVSRSLVTIVWRPPCAGVSTPLSLSVPHGQHRPPTPCGDSPVAESAVLREGGWRGLVRHHHAVWGCDMLGFCCVLQLLCMCSMLRAAYSARFLCLSVWTVVWRLPRIADPIRHPIPWCGPRYGFRSWAVAVCVAIKYVVLCITLDRTCTDTLTCLHDGQT